MKLPPPLNWLWAGWMKLSEAMGFVMSRILLTVLWIVAFGLYAVMTRAVMLFQAKKPKPASYWIETEKEHEGSMKYQF